MIWLIFLIPLLIVCAIAIYLSKTTGAVPPDVNKGSHNVEAEMNNHQLNNWGGGGSGS